MQQTPGPNLNNEFRPLGALAPMESAAPHSMEIRSVDTKPVEIGGPQGLEPTRYGDWERNGRCVDF